MKASTRRLLILDVIIAVVAVLQLSLPAYPKLLVPAILSDVVLGIYGLWLLARMWGQQERLDP